MPIDDPPPSQRAPAGADPAPDDLATTLRPVTAPGQERPGDARPRLGEDVGEASTLSTRGRVLGDRYEVRRELGRGGMGRVVMAFDRRLGRMVAIKELLEPDPAARERFEREVRITARLQHPSIVSIYEAGVAASGEPFYVMPQVPGRTLDEALLAAASPAKRLALLPHLIGACEAMAYVHQQQIVHRDLKPANILVGAFGETVVIDWGLAKSMATPEASPSELAAALGDSGLTQVGHVVGTPDYMAPEQARGAEVDARSDVYALGVILWRLLLGSTPYPGSSPMAIVRAVVAGPPPEPQWGDLPSDLVAIVKKAMAHEPAARYRGAPELVADLRRFQAGRLVAAHRYSLGELVTRWVRRHRTLLAMAALSGAVALTSGVISLRRVIESRRVAVEARALAEQLQHQAERDRQRSLLDQAHQQMASDPTGALSLLSHLSPSLPGWERARFLAEEALSGDVARWAIPAEGLTGIALVPGSPRLALGMSDGRVVLWDSKDGGARVLGKQTASITALAASADGRSLASATADGAAWVWDLTTARARVVSEKGDAIDSAVFLQDHTLALIRGAVLELWDPASGRRIERIEGAASAVADERTHAVLLRRLGADAELYRSAAAPQRFPLGDDANNPRATADGRFAVDWSFARGVAMIDLATGARSAPPGLTATVTTSPAILDSHTAVILVDRHSYAVWEAGAKVTRPGNLDCDAEAVTALDGSRVVFTCGDGLELVDLSANTRRLVAMPRPLRAHLTPDGATVATDVEPGEVWIWDLRGQPLAEVSLPDPVAFFGMNDRATRLFAIASGPSGHVDEVDPRRPSVRLVAAATGAVDSISMSESGDLVAWLSAAADEVGWRAAGGTVHRLHIAGPHYLNLTEGGRELVVASVGGLDIFDTATEVRTHLAADGEVSYVEVAADGAWLVAADAATHQLTVWSRTGKVLQRLDALWESFATLTADTRWLINGRSSGEIEVWSTTDWSHHLLPGPARSLRALERLADGSAVVTADTGGALWLRPLDGRPGRKIAELPFPVQSVIPSGNSQRLAALDNQGNAVVVEVLSGATWELRDRRGLFDDIAPAGGSSPCWVTARGTQLRIWNDHLPLDPEGILKSIRGIPEVVSITP